jgi:two-component system, sensor histidine kinase ChiS
MGFIFFVLPFVFGLFSNASHAFMGNSFKADRIEVGRGTALENKPIIKTIQDRDGFIWFISKEGLARYDGNRQKVYEIKRETTSNVNISTVFYKEPFIWIGTWEGDLYRFHVQEETFIKMQSDDLPKEGIQALHVSQENKLWLSTQNMVYQYNETEKKVEVLKVAEGSLSNTSIKGVRRIVEDRSGDIVLGTDKGIYYYNTRESTVTSYVQLWNAPNSIINAVVFDENNMGWIASHSGFYRFDRSKEEFQTLIMWKSSINNTGVAIQDLALGKNGDIYLATDGEGLKRFNFKTGLFQGYKYEYSNPYSIRNNRIWSSFVDRDGNLWLGLDGEVNLIGRFKNTFEHTKKIDENEAGLLNSNVTAIAQDREGNLWIGTPVGLNQYSRNRSIYTQYKYSPDDPNSLSDNGIHAIVTDVNGGVWVGTNKGLNRYMDSMSGFVRYAAGENDIGLPSDRITALAADTKGNVFIGTNRGLQVYDVNQLAQATDAKLGLITNALRGVLIKTIRVSDQNEIWVGTDAGIYMLAPNSGSVTRYQNRRDQESSLSSDLVNSIWTEEGGSVWVGTGDGILNKFNRGEKTFTRYGTGRGIEADVIYGVLGFEDLIWMSTNRGLIRFHTKNLNSRRFTLDNGLQNNGFNPGAFFISEDKHMFFGGDNGFNHFYPKDIEATYPASALVISHLYLDGIEIPRQQTLELTHKNNSLTIEFALLDYTNSDKHQFQYQLVGVDKERIEAGNRNIASYSNLGPGKYSFQVTGRNSAGEWNDAGIRIPIRQKTHPLKTWWAYGIYGILGIASVLSYVKIKTSWQAKELMQQRILVAKLQKIDKMKDDFLANTSHELRTPLNGIIGISETLRDGLFGELTGKAKNNVSVVIQSAKRLLKLVNDILDLSVLNKGEFVAQIHTLNFREVFDACLDTLNALAHKKGIQIVDKVENPGVMVRGDSYRMQQVLYNVAGNAIKFTSKGYVEMGTQVVGDYLEVYVKDTGSGIPKDKLDYIFKEFAQVDSSDGKQYAGTGLGLAITKKLMESMGGSIRVESQLGEGTTFRFAFPRENHSVLPSVEVVQAPSYQEYVEETFEVKDLYVDIPKSRLDEKMFEKTEGYFYKILIVDDEMINRVDLNNRFAMEGNFVTHNAKDGIEALEIIAQEPDFDLVLMDVMMPRMTGIECCVEIRKQYSHYELPILMLTAKDQTKDILEGFQAGANDYLVKPFDREVLKARSKNLLGLKRGVKAALEKSKSLKSEKQKRQLSETISHIATEVSKTLNTTKIISLMLEKMQGYFGIEKAIGVILVDGGAKLIKGQNQCDLEELFVGFLENKEDSYVQEMIKAIKEPSYREKIRFLQNKRGSRKNQWKYFPIVHHNKLQGMIWVDVQEKAIDETTEDILTAILYHAGSSIENAKLYNKVKALATMDPLTGINNRRFFFEKSSLKYQEALVENARYGILMLDIDNFKKINDHYGHGQGDDVLKKLGEILRDAIDKNGVCGRFGGEEFVVALKGEREILDLAEKIRSAVEKMEFKVDGAFQIFVTVSIGVSFHMAHDKDLYDIVKRADVNLYKAKNSGKNKVVYDEQEMYAGFLNP